jgi:membrane-bound ClpP family serine protease
MATSHMNTLDPLVWSALLMLVGCLLIVLEVFIPSGGILGFLAATAVFSAIVLAFYHEGRIVGFAFVAVAVVGTPVILALALKYWPRTPLGRRFLLGLPTPEEASPDDERHRALKALIGKQGTARSPMLPSGAISVDGRTIDAVSQGMPIDAGQRVVIIEVKANRVVVRPVDDREQPRGDREDGQDVLSQPLDALGLEPLDDPLA